METEAYASFSPPLRGHSPLEAVAEAEAPRHCSYEDREVS